MENTVGKGEIARYKQFLLFPQCFQKACYPGASKGVIVWEWVKTITFMALLSCRCIYLSLDRALDSYFKLYTDTYPDGSHSMSVTKLQVY